MKTIIVGGDFGIPRESGVIKQISNEFDSSLVVNGGTLNDLPKEIDSDLILWMPNINNEEPKQYPIKSVGNVLIVSKVIREGNNDVEAVTRIFKMHGNAVIAIYREEKFRFKLIDALGNVWYDGINITELSEKIKEFYEFTKLAIRVRTIKIEGRKASYDKDIVEFIDINKGLCEYIQTSCGQRYFGNLSTRCMKLFPTMRNNTDIFVSPRNSNKDKLTYNDMVYCEFKDNSIYYIGDNKPSVDTPIQLKIYEKCNQINYMIHGHAFIENAIETSEYYLCGDLREANEVIEIISDEKYGAINLKNHGFLLYSDNLENLKNIIKIMKFTYESNKRV